VISFGGTKTGLLGAEAVVFVDPQLGALGAQRRKQSTQTSSKMRFLAAQFNAGLEDGHLLAWSITANDAAAELAAGLDTIAGVELGYPVDTNAVFVTLPPAVVGALGQWSEFYVWDPARSLVRFVASWDTTADDVERLVAGVRAACEAVR
jgi:threonine aldolase